MELPLSGKMTKHRVQMNQSFHSQVKHFKLEMIVPVKTIYNLLVAKCRLVSMFLRFLPE